MYTEDELLPLSALQHLIFCERQCGLIHVERVWDDNPLTVQGKHMHERVHEQENESRGDVRISRGLPLRSLRLGLTGIADVVEFRRIETDSESRYRSTQISTDSGPVSVSISVNQCLPTPPSACRIPHVSGLWSPFPIEYKRGKPKPDSSDEVQLCAQAMCLEEMLNVEVPAGALFYGKTRRRHDVTFGQHLRDETEQAARRLHELIDTGVTPPPVYEKKCRNCSLLDVCMPKTATRGRSAVDYLESALEMG